MSLFSSIFGVAGSTPLFSLENKYRRASGAVSTLTSTSEGLLVAAVEEPGKEVKRKTKKSKKRKEVEGEALTASEQLQRKKKQKQSIGGVENCTAAQSSQDEVEEHTQARVRKQGKMVKTVPVDEAVEADACLEKELKPRENFGVEETKKTAEEEAEQLTRTIFVGNLPPMMRRKNLKAIFSEYGAVQSVRLRSVPLELDKKLSRKDAIQAKRISQDRGSAHAYVVFEHADSVTKSLQHNMREVHGLHIRVDRTGKSAKDVEYDRSRSVFIGNLAFDITDEEVIQLFNAEANEADAVAAVRIVRDPETNIGKGFGFVLFNSKNGARMALAREGSKLKGRPIRVTKAVVAGRGAARSSRNKSTSNLGRLPSRQPADGGVRKAQEFGTVVRKGPSMPVATWQGVRTKGAGKVVKSSAATARNASLRRRAGAPGKQLKEVEGRRRLTKRPAVIARKAKALGLPTPKVPNTKGKERKKKSREAKNR